MTPTHDPEDTGLPVHAVLAQDHPLSEPLHKLSGACEALQTWASDVASSLHRQPVQGPKQALAAKLVGEKLLGEVLAQAAPVIGHLAGQGGAR